MPKSNDRYEREPDAQDTPPPEDNAPPYLARTSLPLPNAPATPPSPARSMNLIPWRPLRAPQWLRTWLGRS